ncbi:hypothetical protein HaLaN_24191 [Haematococcus lacustris]|uniref:Uncharacterized protein n=1 Tax=Haematococcus lacustris TaxID=44745 RepID=A0A699ZUJ6_HAELA|nr:hypothetical protein HaLaN_24191 [Haematococcus lacustris]
MSGLTNVTKLYPGCQHTNRHKQALGVIQIERPMHAPCPAHRHAGIYTWRDCVRIPDRGSRRASGCMDRSKSCALGKQPHTGATGKQGASGTVGGTVGTVVGTAAKMLQRWSWSPFNISVSRVSAKTQADYHHATKQQQPSAPAVVPKIQQLPAVPQPVPRRKPHPLRTPPLGQPPSPLAPPPTALASPGGSAPSPLDSVLARINSLVLPTTPYENKVRNAASSAASQALLVLRGFSPPLHEGETATVLPGSSVQSGQRSSDSRVRLRQAGPGLGPPWPWPAVPAQGPGGPSVSGPGGVQGSAFSCTVPGPAAGAQAQAAGLGLGGALQAWLGGGEGGKGSRACADAMARLAAEPAGAAPGSRPPRAPSLLTQALAAAPLPGPRLG